PAVADRCQAHPCLSGGGRGAIARSATLSVDHRRRCSMRRFFPHPRMMLVLAVLWLFLVNTFSLGQLLLGLFLAWAIVNLCGDFLLSVPRVRKPLGLLLFIGKVFYDIVVANLQVVRLVLGPKSRL